MNLILVGLNYQTAPVELREQFYLADERLRAGLNQLHVAGLTEVAIVSTCNRLEIVASVEAADAGFALIEAFLRAAHPMSAEELRAHLYTHEGREVVRHLMRVASGLESLILGETQILGQVARAVEQAQQAGTDGAILSHLFAAALHAGKRAHTETGISQHTLSMSHAAVLLLKAHITDFAAQRALVIGAGEMAELAARALQMHNVEAIRLINRTDTKAAAMAERLGIQALKWADLSAALQEADVIIAATGAAQTIISRVEIEALMNERPERPMYLVDMGVPRNIEAEVGTLADARLYDIDDLERALDEHYAKRLEEVAPVEAIIAEEIEKYMQWLHGREVAPLISELRRQAAALAEDEVQHTLNRLPELDAHKQEIVAQMAHRIVNKLLHAPIVSLKAAAGDDCTDYADAVRHLFALDDAP